MLEMIKSGQNHLGLNATLIVTGRPSMSSNRPFHPNMSCHDRRSTASAPTSARRFRLRLREAHSCFAV